MRSSHSSKSVRSINDQLLGKFGANLLPSTYFAVTKNGKKPDSFAQKAKDVLGVEKKETVIGEPSRSAYKQTLSLMPGNEQTMMAMPGGSQTPMNINDLYKTPSSAMQGGVSAAQ